MSWKKRAITKSFGEKCILESMNTDGDGKEYWIVPKKLSYDAMQEISNLGNIDIGEENIDGLTAEQIEEIVKNRIRKKKGNVVFDDNMEKMIRIAFLKGVGDHNFDDENGEKIDWNENLLQEMKEFSSALFEIFEVVMNFNKPVEKKRNSGIK